MSITIKHKHTGNVIFNCDTVADLKDADLKDADLKDADLRHSDLRHADLQFADLKGANLQNADLRGAELRGANLQNADLQNANLKDADLRGANLQFANLKGANLQHSDLRHADLRYAELRHASNAELLHAQLLTTPSTGAFDAWKKCLHGVIVRVRIPADAKRSSATGRTCRADRVEVIEVFGADEGVSKHNDTVVYRVGNIVTCDKWDDDRWRECSGGIHFYITREEAEAEAD